jgi:nicotinate-nucleotide pyrophosphorylase (carboxylating)
MNSRTLDSNSPRLDAHDIDQTVARALAEDIGSGDVTAALIPAGAMADAQVISRQQAVVCGIAWFDTVFRQLDARIHIDWEVRDGDVIAPIQRLCQLHGPARPILTGERTALNFLQTLSATATQAHRYAQAVASTPAKVLDTRKTIPGLRQAQKYAVACGGCHNHRSGLYDAILIKENHILAAGSISAAVQQAQRLHPELLIEVEVENLAQLQEAIQAGAKRILLDNMNPDQLRQAVALAKGQAELEASGGIGLENIRTIAETGVDFISVGELTKHIHAVDLSMRFQTR